MMFLLLLLLRKLQGFRDSSQEEPGAKTKIYIFIISQFQRLILANSLKTSPHTEEKSRCNLRSQLSPPKTGPQKNTS